MNWLSTLLQLERDKTPAIVITVLESRGSTPRNSGTKMVVTAEQTYHTIGGGHLEYKAIKQAREMLTHGNASAQIEHYALGASLGQCCGGAIQLFFEPINPQQLNIVIFGAGHIAQSLLPILAQLPCSIRLIDSREEQLEAQIEHPNIARCLSDSPADEVASLPIGSYVLVMTHNHHLDQAIIEALLKQGDSSFIGMIGSMTKRRKFEHRLRHKGFSEDVISQMTCPVGIHEIKGKLPIEIAISIAGQVIQHYQQNEQSTHSHNKPAALHKLA